MLEGESLGAEGFGVRSGFYWLRFEIQRVYLEKPRMHDVGVALSGARI